MCCHIYSVLYIFIESMFIFIVYEYRKLINKFCLFYLKIEHRIIIKLPSKHYIRRDRISNLYFVLILSD